MNWFTWALLAALFAGATAILAKVGVEGVNSNLATAIRTTVVLVFTWALAWPALRQGAMQLVSTRTLVFLGISGLATGLSWICYFRALQLGQASKVAPVDKLSVPIAIVLAMLFLGERLTLREGIGAGLIVAGVLVMAFK
jgi:bacterial/archaeal transporter family protein